MLPAFIWFALGINLGVTLGVWWALHTIRGGR